MPVQAWESGAGAAAGGAVADSDMPEQAVVLPILSKMQVNLLLQLCRKINLLAKFMGNHDAVLRACNSLFALVGRPSLTLRPPSQQQPCESVWRARNCYRGRRLLLQLLPLCYRSCCRRNRRSRSRSSRRRRLILPLLLCRFQVE